MRSVVCLSVHIAVSSCSMTVLSDSLRCSDEDTDVKALVTAWLAKQDPDARENLQGWLDDYFYKALEWVLKQVLNDTLKMF